MTPTSIHPDQNLGVLYNGYTVQVTAPAGCAWHAAVASWSRFWEIRSSLGGPVIDGGTGSGSVFLACTADAYDCRAHIASFNIAGTTVIKWSLL